MAKKKKRPTRAPATPSPRTGRRLIYEIDLHGMTWDEAERRLRAAPTEATHMGARALKIIHGYGRTTGTSVLQAKVRGWLARAPFSFRAAIPGEHYAITNLVTVEMRDALGPFPDSDLNASNEGITLVWLR